MLHKKELSKENWKNVDLHTAGKDYNVYLHFIIWQKLLSKVPCEWAFLNVVSEAAEHALSLASLFQQKKQTCVLIQVTSGV